MRTLSDLNGASRAAFVAALGHLFEHSPWIVEEAYEKRRIFRDAEHLHSELCAVVQRAPVERQLALIRAHPDLAGRLAQAGRLTAESTREQSGAGLDRLSSEELAKFTQRNDAYRERFGFPFVICARLNNRSAILEAMDARVRHSPDEERLAALTEIEKIAWLRLQDVLISSN